MVAIFLGGIYVVYYKGSIVNLRSKEKFRVKNNKKMLKRTKKKIRILWIIISVLAALGMVGLRVAPYPETTGM